MGALIVNLSACTAEDNAHTGQKEMAQHKQDSTSHFSHPDHDHTSEPGSREMARQEETITINHFSHPGHELVKRHYTGSFLCDMCWEDLSGPAYGCLAGCNFCIHDSCAGHPQTLSSPAHDAHPIVLVQTRRDDTLWCDVCWGRCAPSSFVYRCPPCGFDMHPTYARLPQVVRSSRHSEHDLTLVFDDGSCAACHRQYGAAGRAWYYRCTTCSVDFHVSCAATTGDNSNAHPACHNGNSHVQQASAGQMQAVARDFQRKLQVDHLLNKLVLQGLDNALDYMSNSRSTVRMEYYYL